VTNVGGEGVDAAQHGGADEGVVVIEVAGQCLPQLRKLGPHAAMGQVGEYPGVTFSGDHRLEHLAAGYAVQVTDDRVEFDLGIFEYLSSRSFSRVRSRTRLRR
jgi:hypothetical protein